MSIETTSTIGSEKKRKFAMFYLIIGAVAIGFAPIFVRLSEVGPIATAFWRVAIAFPILTLLSLGQGSTYPTDAEVPNFKDYLWILFAGILFGGDLATWHLSIQYTTIANSTLLANFSPVLIALWGWAVLHKPPQKKLVIGLLFAIVGVAILISPHLHMDKRTAAGDGLAFITAFFYAGYLLVLNRSRKKFTAATSMAISTFSSMLTLLIITYFSGESFLPHTGMAWIILIALALFSHILGQGLIAYALPYLPVTFASTALLVQPMVAAMAGWLLFSEYLSLIQMSGILIALVGIFLAKQTT
ncbi:putative transmembrane protein [Candidatus Rickettsiella viridis]|uniref:Putative transmembrane protein n=1 Tax=Candidatus Rickettsiella viridis TaxID=676208 RepID=A0A2Z5UVW4_9COXI|nr:DMT family transporter [Candidatus Rickettsiella viridis]BBB15756.1 putative transmembrane protein [Candidatus Rickettsiella viridis]